MPLYAPPKHANVPKMDGGSKVVGIGRRAKAAAAENPVFSDSDDELLLDEAFAQQDEPAPIEQERTAEQPDSPESLEAWTPAFSPSLDEFGPPSFADVDETGGGNPTGLRIMRIVLVVLALGWTGFFGWVQLRDGAPPLAAVPTLVSAWVMPLVLLGLAYLLLIRNSRAEAHRFAATAGLLRVESQMLQERLSRMAQDMARAHDQMEQQANRLAELGDSATSRISSAAVDIAAQADSFQASTARAQSAGDALNGTFRNLEQAMPQIEDRASRVSALLVDAMDSLANRLDNLEALIKSASSTAADARSDVGAATKSLSAELSAAREQISSTATELTGLADITDSRIAAAASASSSAIDDAATRLDEQAHHLQALTATARDAIDAMGRESLTKFENHGDAIADRLSELEKLMEAQASHARTLHESLDAGLENLNGRFAQMEADGLTRNERLGAALTALTQDAERMDKALAAGNATADLLIAQSERLLLALDTGAREIDETLPLALQRLDDKLAASSTRIAVNADEVERLEAAAEGMVGTLNEAGAMLGAQAGALDALLSRANAGFSANRDNVGLLRDAVAKVDEDVRRMADDAGPQLINALLRVREIADSAAERAKETLARAIPEAADALGQASARAMEGAVTEQVAQQMHDLSLLAEKAVDAARQASDRLTRQILTISEASSALEAHIEQAEERARERDSDSFARRSAMLIDSLNSRSIDVTKLLSSDVSDASWAAYLKGDRGVFSRRAVRLLDSGEARQISTLYQDDLEFRDHVNRYIHDFEAMLRNLLAQRDGSALGVTMLSSDIGKLYVALAQGIDRLRN